MAESIIQPEPFPKHFYMFDITIGYIYLNTLASMSLSLIIVSTLIE